MSHQNDKIKPFYTWCTIYSPTNEYLAYRYTYICWVNGYIYAQIGTSINAQYAHDAQYMPTEYCLKMPIDSSKRM